ncbi:MAG: hypothetical protein KF789_03385 [Bdellovibrionaceae bacterium]|nr:hypothetical protein [Pseudobdellovibrionaceae bacterium]
MAKILLVSQRLTPTAIRLATSLHEQQHQVTMITSSEEDAVLPAAVVMMRPFKNWTVRECLRLTPLIYMMGPQIVHLVLEEDRMSPAEVFLSLLAKTLPGCILTTSLLHIRQGLRKRNPVRYLLQESDVVTCASVDSLGALRGLNVRSRRQGRGLLPPVLDFQEDKEGNAKTAQGAELQKGLRKKPYVVLPFLEGEFRPTHPFFRRLRLLAAHRHVVLLGSFAAWPLRERKRFQAWMDTQGVGGNWTLSGELSTGDQQRLLADTEALILAGLSLSPLETTEYFLRAIRAGANLVIDDRQSMIHSDLWRHGESCWILKFDNVPSALEKLLSEGPLRKLQTLPESLSLHRDLVDGPLNELNRLYNKALSHKHNL